MYCSFSFILFCCSKFTYNFLFQCNWLAVMFLTLAIMLRSLTMLIILSSLTLVIMLILMTLVFFCHHNMQEVARGGVVG